MKQRADSHGDGEAEDPGQGRERGPGQGPGLGRTSTDSDAELLVDLIGDLLDRDRVETLRNLGLEITLHPAHGMTLDGELRAKLLSMAARWRGQQAKAQRLATLGTMGAGIVHEARNLLTAIVGFAQVAQRNGGAPRRQDLLAVIESETKRVAEMLSQFLSFARNRPKTLMRFDLSQSVATAGRATRHQLRMHDIDLDIAVSEVPMPLLGSPEEIEQVLINLIVNAQQASSKGSTVWVGTARVKDRARVTVSDRGCGIGPADLDKIFEPFFTTKAAGTGLGLAICKRIAEEHDGELLVDSEVGVGTTFTLILPIGGGASGNGAAGHGPSGNDSPGGGAAGSSDNDASGDGASGDGAPGDGASGDRAPGGILLGNGSAGNGRGKG